MKRIILFLSFAASSVCLFAQDQAPTQTNPAPVKKEAKTTTPKETHKVVLKNYCCPSCDYVSTRQGTCPEHKKALIRDGMYYCEDGTVSREKGKCADGKEMIRMVDKSNKKKEIKTTPGKTDPATDPAKSPEAK